MKGQSRSKTGLWEEFDPEDYVSRNYTSINEIDFLIEKKLAAFYKKIGPVTNVVDVGTGPNLYPLFAALPWAQAITAVEYSSANVNWLRKELKKPTLSSGWQEAWHELVSSDNAYAAIDPLKALAEKLKVRQGSIYDLTERNWNVATMFFCAESITDDFEEFSRGLRMFLGSVNKNGHFFAAFMEGSKGYTVGDVRFPAVELTKESLCIELNKHLTRFEVQRLEVGDKPIRAGYSGILLASGSCRD